MQYRASIGIQPRNQEIISNIGELVYPLLAEYIRLHGTHPEGIIYLRDGVGESQYDMVFDFIYKAFAMAHMEGSSTIDAKLAVHIIGPANGEHWELPPKLEKMF